MIQAIQKVLATPYSLFLLFFADGKSLLQQSSHRKQPFPSKYESDWTEGFTGASSSHPVPVGCGCGKCNLYTLCTKCCSKPGGTPLPIWNVTESTFPTNGWQLSYAESELSHATTEMSVTFANLVIETLRSFSRNVSLNEVALWIKQLQAIESVTKPSPPLAERMEEANKAETLEKLFWILSEYWSWYNICLLEGLITQFGDQEDQKRLWKYQEEFSAFLEMRRLPKELDHFNLSTAHGKDWKPVLIKVDEKWEEISLGQIRRLHYNIAKALNVPLYVLYLSSVSKGCICLNFMVPSIVADHLFPLSASQEKALLTVNAFRLECGEYVWQVCTMYYYSWVTLLVFRLTALVSTPLGSQLLRNSGQ